MEEDGGEPPRLLLDDDHPDAIGFHRWFAIRGTSAARAAVAFTMSPEWLGDSDKHALIATGDDEAIAAAIMRGTPSLNPVNTGPRGARKDGQLLDLCAGIGTVAAIAARLGFDAVSVELSVVPHLINQVLHDFAVSMATPSTPSASTDGEAVAGWRGYAAEVDDFAGAVWAGAKERLNDLFEEDVDTRIWVRIAPCPSCGRQVPVLSNVRLSRDTALDISPGPGPGREGAFPRFGLLRTEFPERKGTFARGVCTCPSCGFQFPFQGHELISLRSVPVAVRMRDSATLDEIGAPDSYVTRADAAAHRSLAASSRSLGNRAVLGDQQSIFHDAHGEPISVRDSLLPRQRAYFAALAESMARQSATLAERAEITPEHRFAVSAAVALLISGQIEYVNTYIHSFVDKPHPSTNAGPLQAGGLFAEFGGYWLERYWRTRLSRLLDLLREGASAARPVRAVQADAAKVPLGDSSAAAVVWDPPYYDNVDYDTAGEPFQAILAAMLPGTVSEPAVPPRLPSRERKERYERELLRQAGEARRLVGPDGNVGVFWLASKQDELQRFLDMVRPAGLVPRSAVRLDTIRTVRVATAGQETYLLVLKPVQAAAAAVVVDAEKVLALATAGDAPLYDGLAELLESVWEPADLNRIIPAEFHGSPRRRLVGFLAGHPDPEQLLVVELGRIALVRELAKRGEDGDELRAMDALGLAQRLLEQLGFAVARPVRFSIRAALRECEIRRGALELADTAEAFRGTFFTCCDLIERILRYATLSWSRLALGSQWESAFAEIVSAAAFGRYRNIDLLHFGEHELLFVRLPAVFSGSDDEFQKELFGRISRAIKRAKVHDKLSELVGLRNSVEHNKEDIASLSLAERRERCSKALADACATLADLDGRQLLPLTVRPEEERRDRYGRRILQLLDPDEVAIEVHVATETNLTEPLIYFASGSSRRDVYPRFLRAAVVEDLLGLA